VYLLEAHKSDRICRTWANW